MGLFFAMGEYPIIDELGLGYQVSKEGMQNQITLFFYNYEHPKERAPSNFAFQAC